jgi:hypothetical protein
MIARVGFVEANAVGPGAVQRVEDSHVTFTIFLQEGYQHRAGRTPPSRLAPVAPGAGGHDHKRLRNRLPAGGEPPQMSGMLGPMAFLALAPFLGAEAASRLIARQSRS